MYWPSPQDYNEAVQTPQYSFADEELRRGAAELTAIGLPKPVTGNFASVYRFETGDKLIAVKCFLRHVPDQLQRYEQLSRFMAVKNSPHIVDFQYLEKGIRVKADWYPVLKMTWIDGVLLDQHLRKQVGNKSEMEKLADRFQRMVCDLKQLGIAHGDLQHGNIMVQPSALRLVDYDGMFVPALAGSPSNELGHPNYQHPGRTNKDFSPALDDFSAWQIHSSLLIAMSDPLLFKKYNGGDECILFRQPDLQDAERSRIFRELTNHPNQLVKERAELIKRLADCPLSKIPAFSDRLPDLNDIAREIHSVEVSSAAKKTTNLPDWMLPDEVTATKEQPSKPIKSAPAGRPIPSHLKQAPRLPAQIKWPTIEQYDLAVLKPATALRDQRLSDSRPIKHKITGKNGIVYQIATGEQQFALKCFINESADRDRRYESFVSLKNGPLARYLVDFDYFPEGIKVENSWFPALTMHWLQAEPLDRYVLKMMHANNRAAIDKLILSFRAMMLELQNYGIAHGDLEPGNIFIDQSGAIKLVDYDNMFTPELSDLSGEEAGHAAYQHPARIANPKTFGPWLDNFPALLIDSVLTVMALPPGSLNNPTWESALQLLRPRSWSPGDPRSPVTRRSRLLKDLQMTKLENVPPLNAAIKL